MKKIFTLIAVAAMAISANAQTYQLTVGDKTAAGTKITSVADIAMTYGAAGDAEFKEVKANGDDLKANTGYNAKTDGNGVNPVDGANKGFNKGGGTPVTGTFYLFEPTKDGNLEVFIVCNANKVFAILEDGVNIATSETAFTYKAYDENGSEISTSFSEDNRGSTDTQGLAFADKIYGTITFAVKANKKYHVFCAGSKLGFGGFTFPASATGIESVKASVKAAQNGATYNVAGQKVNAAAKGLVIKNGVKVINK